MNARSTDGFTFYVEEVNLIRPTSLKLYLFKRVFFSWCSCAAKNVTENATIRQKLRDVKVQVIANPCNGLKLMQIHRASLNTVSSKI